MASRINIISKAAADKIAASYLSNKKVHSLYVTRDGQVFYKGKEGYMRMHEKHYKLEKSWFYSGHPKIEVKEIKEIKKEVQADNQNMSFAALKQHFQNLTNKGEIKESEWSGLKFAQLQKKYKELKK